MQLALYRDGDIPDMSPCCLSSRIHSLAEYLEALASVKQGKEAGISLYYRGQVEKTLRLLPSIYRTSERIRHEQKITHDALCDAPRSFARCKYTVERLQMMQHYNNPTRLMDITRNPLVALYFACCDGSEQQREGVIHFFQCRNGEMRYYDSDVTSMVANIAMMWDFFDISSLPHAVPGQELSSVDKAKVRQSEPMKRLVGHIRHEKNNFAPEIEPTQLNRCYFVKPRLFNERMRLQQGLFLLFGIQDKKIIPADPADCLARIRWVDGNKYPVAFTIPAENKDAILAELEDFCGIHHATLFPELDQIYETRRENRE
jgi:hypothetical protein